MGNYISNNSLYMLAKRTLMRYNVENRAFKEIERQTNRPVVAPKHEAGTINYHKAMQDNKEYLTQTQSVNADLDHRLKDVFVTSTGLTENIKNTKPLPLQRYTETFALGYKDSDNVPPGRVSLLQAIKILTDHQSNPKEYSVERLAEENKIKVEYARDLIKYYQAFNAYFPKDFDQKTIGKMKSDLKLLGATNNENK